MAINRTDWQIIVQARTGQAQKAMAGLAAQAKTAEGAFQNFSNVQGTVTQQLKTTPRVFDKLTTQIKSGKLSMEQYGRVMKHTSAIVRRQNQLQNAAVAGYAKTDGAMGSMSATMQTFRQSTARLTQRLALANTATRAMATGMVDFGKNMQWAGRQIMVGFTVPFGIAMLAASKAFTDFEEEVIRFRKVFNDELGATTEEAEERVINLANTMARELGYARNDIIETAATFAQMGKSVDEIERLTEATTRLSLLGEVPKETATQLIRAYAASGFDEAAGGIENVVNHLNALENSTSLTTEMMASSLPQIIPIFEQMNLKFGEGEAIIAGMTESLGSANQSVNALKMGLQRVYDPTQQAIDAFADMGINLLAIRERNENDIIGFFGELGELMEGQIETNIEFADTIGNLFGVRRAGHLATALRSINDAQSDFARGMGVTMQSAAEQAATADEEIAAQVESIGGRLKKLKESMLIEITEIGQMFLKMAMPFFEMVGSLLERFNNLDEGTKKAVLAVGALSGAFAGIIMMGGIFVNLLGMTVKAFTRLLPILSLVTEEELSMTAALKMYAEQSKAAFIPMERREQQHRQNAAAMNAEAQAASRLGHEMRTISGISIGNRGVLPMAGGVGDEAIRKGVQGRGARVKWRTGAMTAGAVGMGVSMLPGMSPEVSQGLMAGSMGVEAMALLGGRGKGLRNIVSRMKEASAAAGSMTGKLGKGAAMARTLAVGLATSTGVIAAVAGGAYLVYKHVQNAKKEAAALRNEFQLSDDIASDLGLELEKGAGSLSTAWGGQSKEDAEELSDSMKLVVDRVNELRGQEGGADRIQAIFRNMAREWLSGGATIEEINKKLNELEAIVGVDIDEASRNRLRQTVSDDISNAINDSLLNFSGDTSFWRSLFSRGERFSYSDEEDIRNSVQAVMGGIQSSMADAGGFTNISNILGEFYTKRNQRVGDDTEALREFNRVAMETMNLRFNIPEDHASELESIEETFSYVYSRLASDKDALIDMSKKERENLYRLVDAYGEYELYVRDASVADDEFAASVEDSRQAIVGASMDLGNLGEEMRVEADALSTLDSRYSNFTDLLATGTGNEISATITRLQGMREQFGDNADMVEYLNVVIQTMQQHLSKGFVAPFEIIPQWRIDALDKREQHRENMAAARNFGKDAGSEITEGIEEEAEDAAKSYIDAFRSELDRRRDEVIDSVLDQYDEQTDAILENLEERQDSELDLLQERHDKEIELLENAKNAEIEALEARKDAIDEYIEKQNNLEDALNKQLDLILAIAGGDVDRAAQLQNEMMFQGVDEVAEAEKERLDKQIEGVNDEHDAKIKAAEELHEKSTDNLEELHDLRMDQEEEARKAQRKTLEEQLEKTKDIFIGTEAGWNKFLGEVGKTAGRFGTTIDRGLMGGYHDAMDAIERDARLDHMWDNADFSGLRDRIAKYITEGAVKGGEAIKRYTGDGAAEGIQVGLHSPRVQQAYSGRLNGLAERYNKLGVSEGVFAGLHTKKVQVATRDRLYALARRYTGNAIVAGTDDAANEVKKKYPTVGGGILPTVRHSGGPIGGGPPKDVPAILQTGEYVIQRKAAQQLGPEVLAQINNAHKYHSGGEVANSGYLGAGQHIGSIAAASLMQQVGATGGNISGVSPMDPSKYGAPTWGKAARNTLAAKAFIDERFNNVKGAYTSVGRGDPKSDHSYGKAIDVMMAALGKNPDRDSKQQGWQIAEFFQDNPDMFGTKYVIWQGLISSKSVDGLKKWRPYWGADEGVTQGHYDHVHLSFLHGGGSVGKDGLLSLAKGGKIQQDNTLANLHKGELVLRKPVSQALEAGIERLNRGDGGTTNHFEFNFENFNGTRAEARDFAREVEQVLDQAYRRKNPTRSIK